MNKRTAEILEMQAAVIKFHTKHHATKRAAINTVKKLDTKTLRREYKFVQSHS